MVALARKLLLLVGLLLPTTLHGGPYEMTASFWSVGTVQTPDGLRFEIRIVYGELMISWKETAQDYVLEVCSGLAVESASTIWEEILPPNDSDATDHYELVPPANTRQVFRLRKPKDEPCGIH